MQNVNININSKALFTIDKCLTYRMKIRILNQGHDIMKRIKNILQQLMQFKKKN